MVLDGVAAILEDKIKDYVEFMTSKGVKVINSKDVPSFV